MSNLISRDTVISTIHNYFKSLIDKTIFDIAVVDCAKGVSEAIDSIPTAYDVGKVVEQLKEYEICVYVAESDEDYYVIDTIKAIDIVKGAVKDD